MDHAALAAEAAQHAGAFSSKHAVSAGWTARQIRAHREKGVWRRLYEGAYVDAQLWSAMDHRARALCRLHARLLVVGDDWHAARGSALLIHGLPFIGKPPEVPQLVSPRVRTHAVSSHERYSPLPSCDRELVDGCRVTSAARTVADHARDLGFLSGVVAADAALHAGLPRAELEQVAVRCASWAGAGAMQRVIGFADARAESAFESLSRVRMAEMDIPMPELQLEIWHEGGFVARPDFLWAEFNLIGESDGRSKYTQIDQFYAEKKREERLKDLGFELVRWDWDTAWREPELLEAKLRRGLVRGRLNALAADVRLRPTEVPERWAA
jgi:hypothetical protein